MLSIIRNFALAYKMIVNYPECAAVIAQHIAWVIFMPLLYPHTAASLRKINAHRVLSSCKQRNDAAFRIYNLKRYRL